MGVRDRERDGTVVRDVCLTDTIAARRASVRRCTRAVARAPVRSSPPVARGGAVDGVIGRAPRV
ncbi:unannotated protein [freshwater metagenome]|uniref:Unannotated protein n=1 Tax=freshwater metagenome TaxID=449393 RepID=A0A6J7JZQ3_9ZZZZ